MPYSFSAITRWGKIQMGFSVSTRTINAFGYELSWLHADGLFIERLAAGRAWRWQRGLGRWTVLSGRPDYVDGWVRA